MRLRSFTLFALAFFLNLTAMAQEQKLKAYMDTKQFYAPEIGNYIEIYFQFAASSVKYKGVEGGLQGDLAIKLDVTDGTKTVASDAYRLQSPLMKDSIVEDFFDLKRFALAPGKYILNIELSDINTDNPALKASVPVLIEDLSTAISISDIEVAEFAFKGDENSVFFKSGINIIPRLSTFYPTELSIIPVYLEIYNTNQLEDTVCGLKQSLIDMETGAEVSEFTVFSRHSTSNVLPILRKVDINLLPTGKYALNYTLLSRSLTELSTQQYIFERSNDLDIPWSVENMVIDPAFQSSITNDSVTYYLESLIPIAKPAEIKNIISVLKLKDLEQERRHIQAFWLKTAPNNAYDSWLKYKEQIQLVERLYSNNFQEGFETDRGRVYLQYGAPTTIVERETSPTEYPYEIWQYNKIGKFSNKRFVFYNPDLVNNAYRLLHSDMLGELKNPSWPQTLSKRNTNNGNIDNPNEFLQQNWGGNSNDFFRQY
jgi:GWxTD domain-containing protein